MCGECPFPNGEVYGEGYETVISKWHILVDLKVQLKQRLELDILSESRTTDQATENTTLTN